MTTVGLIGLGAMGSGMAQAVNYAELLGVPFCFASNGDGFVFRDATLADVQRALLRPAAGGSFCEWKGPARYWDLVDGARCLPQVAWSYPQPLAGAEPLADCVAFYAHDLDCTVGGEKVIAQAGGFYGGWITPDLAGPFKGAPGSGDW